MVIFTAQLIGAAIAVLVAMTLFPVAQAPAAGEDLATGEELAPGE